MENIYLVTVTLINLRRSEEYPESGMLVNLVFDEQPTPGDVLTAFAAEPTLNKRPDYLRYRAQLQDALETYGVPKLNMHQMMDEHGQHLGVPRACARWIINVVAAKEAHSDVDLGQIAVSIRPIHTATPKQSTAQAAKTTQTTRRFKVSKKTKVNQSQHKV